MFDDVMRDETTALSYHTRIIVYWLLMLIRQYWVYQYVPVYRDILTDWFNMNEELSYYLQRRRELKRCVRYRVYTLQAVEIFPRGVHIVAR